MYYDTRDLLYSSINKEEAVNYVINSLITDEYWSNDLSSDNIFWVSTGQAREYIEIIKK